jgi:hypothetical protein
LLLPDGRVAFIPGTAKTVGIFNASATPPTYSELAGLPGNSSYENGVLLADDRVLLLPWRTRRIGILSFSDEKARARAHKRTQEIKQELIAAAWHPSRMLDWCLDNNDRCELAEMELSAMEI